MNFIAECGSQSGDIIIKTDQEHAIGYFVKDIVIEKGGEKGCRTIVEESPAGRKGSSRIVERAAQTAKGHELGAVE